MRLFRRKLTRPADRTGFADVTHLIIHDTASDDSVSEDLRDFTDEEEEAETARDERGDDWRKWNHCFAMLARESGRRGPHAAEGESGHRGPQLATGEGRHSGPHVSNTHGTTHTDQRGTRKKPLSKRVKKHAVRVVRSGWKYLRRGLGGYATGMALASMFMWGVNLNTAFSKRP